MRRKPKRELLFSPNRAGFGMKHNSHNGLVPGSSPGGPTSLFKYLAADLRRSRGFIEPKRARVAALSGS
jgi:hypothetical protein